MKANDLWDAQWESPGVFGRLTRACDDNPQFVRQMRPPRFWADLKLHDTPGTVGNRAGRLKDSGAYMATVHAQGGIKMMHKAVIHGPERILAITLLTSIFLPVSI
jgi:orotidine-5'-phosphate decarboxylase